MAGRLAGKVAIVTGAGTALGGLGNGKATTLLFAQEGARVLAVDRDRAAAEEVAAMVAAAGGQAVPMEADVTDPEMCAAVTVRCVAAFGGIDVLDNNVGVGELGGPVETSLESWERVMRVNLTSAFLMCKHAIPIMLRGGGGSIVNIASIAAIRFAGVPLISYAASKAALVQFSRHVGLQYARRGLRCNTVLPGLIDTPMPRAQVMAAYSGRLDADEMQRRRDAQSPTGKQGSPWDVARAALFLASEESAYVNATELIVDGGLAAATALLPE